MRRDAWSSNGIAEGQTDTQERFKSFYSRSMRYALYNRCFSLLPALSAFLPFNEYIKANLHGPLWVNGAADSTKLKAKSTGQITI